MKAASIDIGTNSVLLLVAERTKSGLLVLHEKQELPRLGKGVDRDRNLSIDSQNRVIAVLKSYKEFLNERYPDIAESTIVTATSAVRDAINRNEFIDSVKRETGWNIKLLSGKEEAQITYSGALEPLDISITERYVILDIGGGSTEIAVGIGRNLINGFSVDMGSVRFSERYFQTDLQNQFTVDHVRNQIKKNLEYQTVIEKPFTAVGVAGTVTSIAAISCGLEKYQPNELNGIVLSRVEIDRYIELFSNLAAKDIEDRYPRFLRRRGDVILAGIIILSEFLKWCECDTITVSTGGIRHGMIP